MSKQTPGITYGSLNCYAINTDLFTDFLPFVCSSCGLVFW